MFFLSLSFSKHKLLSFNKCVVDRSPHCGFPDIETHRSITEHCPPRLHAINAVIESQSAAGRFSAATNYRLLWKRRRDYGREAEAVWTTSVLERPRRRAELQREAAGASEHMPASRLATSGRGPPIKEVGGAFCAFGWTR